MPATIDSWRRWLVLPDGLGLQAEPVVVKFESDPTVTAPSARLRSTGADVRLTPTGTPDIWTATLDLRGARPGFDNVDVVERLRDVEIVIANKPVIVSEPEYVVWTVDFEGDASSDQAMANTAAIADEQRIPMTIRPYIWMKRR